ncbi:hypothetical protein ACR79T_10110 [Sphingobacterium spiritivorum]|uniref:hypothetical protein n=1 Tax=Sphingobacterium spiritivorum TaxID=258 RepID=UPI003DA4A4DB
MRFEKVTHDILRRLRDNGYTLLKAKSNYDWENPSFTAYKISDVDGYLMNIDIKGVIPFDEPMLLVIEDALHNIREEDLRGYVFIEEEEI